MKVNVDQLKCTTSGNCVMECPDVFRFQEGSKRATVIRDEIPRRFWNKCRKAVSLCPNNAISIQD